MIEARQRICQDCRHLTTFEHAPRVGIRTWTETVCAYLHQPDAEGACLYVWPNPKEIEVQPDA